MRLFVGQIRKRIAGMVLDEIEYLFEVGVLLGLYHLERQALEGGQSDTQIADHLQSRVSLLDQERAARVDNHEHLEA